MFAINGIITDDLKREIEPHTAVKMNVMFKLLVFLICTKILTTKIIYSYWAKRELESS